MLTFEDIGNMVAQQNPDGDAIAWNAITFIVSAGVREYHNLGEAKLHFELLTRAMLKFNDKVQALQKVTSNVCSTEAEKCGQ